VNTPPQPGIVLFAYLLQVLAAAMAVTLARQQPEHRPAAWFLGTMAAVDLGRLALTRAVDFATAPRPHVGAVRLAFHVDQEGFLAWPAGLAALALVVFGARRAWPALGAWAVLSATSIALYPSPLVRGEGLQRIYLGAHLGALFVVVATFAAWRVRKAVPGSAHAALFVLATIELVRLAPFNGSIFDSWASFIQPVNVVLYGLLLAIQGGFLWVSSRSR
jgi:hypothetical protein